MTSNYHTQRTGDGTMTLYSIEHDDFMHSLTGALSEACDKHVSMSRIAREQAEQHIIFDIGFGLGYNSFAAMNYWLEESTGSSLLIHGFEKDKELQPLIHQLKPEKPTPIPYSFIQESFTKGCGTYHHGTRTIELIIHFGDARHMIDTINQKAHTVFHDPYTPSKNPELWTLHFFQKLIERMDDYGILTTYSRAPQIRGALINAGFKLGPLPGSALKKEGTMASPSHFDQSIDEKNTVKILNDIKSTPYTDPKGTWKREQILEERLQQMRLKKSLVTPGH